MATYHPSASFASVTVLGVPSIGGTNGPQCARFWSATAPH
jgi:hypothetical protein